MKTALIAASAVALAALAAPAHADFTGPFAPANWTIATPGTLVGGGSSPGSATFSTTQLVLVGGNVGAPTGDVGCTGSTYAIVGPCEVRATIGAPGSFSFHWAYSTADEAGAAGDIFGLLIDGVRTQLSDPGAGSLAQSGNRTFAASSSFGWFLNCTDCTGGAATATITNFLAVQAVPEPETYALMLAGLAAIGVAGRRRRVDPAAARERARAAGR